jgi:hypothetical protein
VELEVRPLHLAIEDVELVSEHHDLDLLCVLGAQGKDGQLQKAAQDPIAQRQDDEVRFRFHGRGRLRHLLVRQPLPTLITKLTEFSAPTRSLGRQQPPRGESSRAWTHAVSRGQRS